MPHFIRRDETDHIFHVHGFRGGGKIAFGQCLMLFSFIEQKLAFDRAALPQIASQTPCINAFHRRYHLTLEPISERALRRMMRWLAVVVMNDHRLRLNPIALEWPFRHAVVSLQRIGADEDLTSIRRIGQRLDITGHAGVEDDFPLRLPQRAE